MGESEERAITQHHTDEEDHTHLEPLLEQQLVEHKQSRADLEAALLQAPLDPELQQLREEVDNLIEEAEMALLDLKKSRLLENLTQLQNRAIRDDQNQEGGQMDCVQKEQHSIEGFDKDDGLEDDGAMATFVQGANRDARDAVMCAAVRGQQTDTKLFAAWESYGRGVASRMMAKMGYVQGKGLGRDKQGNADAIIPRTKSGKGAQRQGLGLDPNQGLAHEAACPRTGRQQTARRKRKAAEELTRDAEHEHELMTGDKGLFQIINKATGDESDAAKVLRYTVASHSVKFPTGVGTDVRGSSESCRKTIVEHQDRLKACKKKVEDLKKMLLRNKDKKELCENLRSILKQAEADVCAAQQLSTSLATQISKRDNLKKWAKF